MKQISYFLISLLVLCVSNALVSQDLENQNFKGFLNGFKDAKPFDLSGNFGLNLRSYSAYNIDNRQAPFIWHLNGNVNVSIYKLRIPISAIVSAQNQTVSHPFHKETLDNLKDRKFNRIGASPYYKWAKMHIGHRSMNFSSFTLANHVFLGGGLELNPGKIRFGGFSGKMAKTEPRDLSLTGFNEQLFERNAFGMKIGYGTNTNFIDFILFKAEDKADGIINLNQDSLNIFRNDNAVLAINAKANLSKSVKVNLEVASSAFTKNTIDPSSANNESHIQDFLLTSKTSTVYRKAINAGADFNGNLFTMGLGFKRIEPDYKSLGTYFFNNDIENYTFKLGFNLLKKKLRVNGTSGLQKNNLFGEKATQLSRRISSLNLNYIHKALNVGLSYSNYSSEIGFVLNLDLDSLNAIVITSSASLNASYILSAKNGTKHILTSNLSLQSVSDDIEDFNRSTESQMINGILAYKFIPDGSQWKMNALLNYNQNELRDILINRTGFGLGLERVLIKDKLNLRVNSNYYKSTGENIDNSTLNLKLSMPYTLGGHHKVNVGLLYLKRLKSGNSQSQDFSEFTSMVNYVFSF